MTTVRQGTGTALEMLARDSTATAARVETLRARVAVGALPAGVEWTTEQDPAGRVRVGLLNRATRGVVWLTDWF